MFHKYPYSDFHELNLDWLLNRFKSLLTEWAAMQTNFDNLSDKFDDLKKYVDDYFANLDVQDEVDQYFDALVESGEIIKLLSDTLDGDIVETSFYKPFAQVFARSTRTFDDHYQQGFCIGVLNGRPVTMNCFTDGTPAGENNTIVFTYMDTGVNIGRYNIESGHCNSACYNPNTDKYYIACGGGNSNTGVIKTIDINGNVIANTDLDFDCWAITYNNGYFYAFCGDYLFKLDDDLTEISRTLMNFNDNLVYQGVFSDRLFLYVPCGNTITYATDENMNYFQVYFHDGTYYKDVIVNCPFEIEEADIYDNECYIALNYQRFGQILITDLYGFKRSGYLGNRELINDLYLEKNMYIDPAGVNFFADGSEEFPFSTLARFTSFVGNSVTYLNLHLLNDYLFEPVSIQGALPYTLQLFGHNHKITRLNIRNASVFIVNDLIVTGVTGQTDIMVYANRFVVSHLTLGEQNSSISPNRLMTVGSSFEITGLTINHLPSDVLFYIMGNGYLREINTNVTITNDLKVGFFGIIDVDMSFSKLYKHLKDNYGITYKPQFYYDDSETLSITDLHFPCEMEIGTASFTVTGAPEGYTTNLNGIIVEKFANRKYVITFISRDDSIKTIYRYI